MAVVSGFFDRPYVGMLYVYASVDIHVHYEIIDR